MKICRRFLISGKVQGVGFRAFTFREATSLGVVGWVRNLEDGRVEALVLAPQETMLSLEARIRQGPRGSRVDRVEVIEVEYREALTSFAVIQDGEAPWE
ncbi:MAG: acylphosphatase [Bdellovibrionales bacterium]|nr:acylphosphatase [Bdellovibrionales bacterium]